MAFMFEGVVYDREVEDIAKIFDYTPQYVRDMARAKRIPAIKNGGRWVFNLEKVQSVLLRKNDPSLDDLVAGI